MTPADWEAYLLTSEEAPIDSAPTFEEFYEPAKGASASEEADTLSCVDAAELGNEPAPLREFMTEGFEPRGSATYLTGAGATGKSLLIQQRLTCSAVSLPFLGIQTRPGVSIYITCEDSMDELHRRQTAINAALGVTWEALRGRLYLVSLKGELANELCTFRSDGRLEPTRRWHQLTNTVREVGAEHVGLDNVAHFFPGNENDRHQVAAFVGLLDRLAQDINGGVLFIGHPNKAGDEFSGSTAWENQVRARIYLGTDKGDDGSVVDPDARTLTNSKPNYSRRGEAVRFLWHDWAFLLPDRVPADVAGERAATAQASLENRRFMECLAKCTTDRRAVSHVPGTNYAPTIFARMPEAQRLDKAAFVRAMERLLHIGEIVLDQRLWQDPHRKWKTGIKAAEMCGDPPAATPCGDLRRPPCQTIENACGDARAAPPLYTPYKGRGPLGSAAPLDAVGDSGRGDRPNTRDDA